MDRAPGEGGPYVLENTEAHSAETGSLPMTNLELRARESFSPGGPLPSDAVAVTSGTKTAEPAAEHVKGGSSPEEAAPLLADVDGEAYNLRFATRKLLSAYIPEADPESQRAQSFRVWKSKLSTMLAYQQTMAYAIAATSLGVLVWLTIRFPPADGKGTVFTGNCSTVDAANTALHLGLNILSTLFLGAGNFCLQLLMAPSLSETRDAHRRGHSLDIGVPSVRNLWYIDYKRKIIWVALGFVSSILHLLWNSTFLAAIPVVQYSAAFATHDFQEWPVAWDAPYKSVNDLKRQAANFTRWENTDCISYYSDWRESTRSVVVVTNVSAIATGNQSLMAGLLSVDPFITDDFDFSGTWMCGFSSMYGPGSCRSSLPGVMPDAQNWVIPVAVDVRARVEYCLVGEPGNNDERCSMIFSVPVFIAVQVCIFIACLLISLTAWICRSVQVDNVARGAPDSNAMLVTLGDAVAAFLNVASRGDVGETCEGLATFRLSKEKWELRRSRWFRAVSKRTWLVSMLLMTAALVMGYSLLGASLGTMAQSGLPTSLPTLWVDGDRVGGITGYELIESLGDLPSLIQQILFANMFQLLISFLYLFYNSILTRQLVADELVRFLREKKPLRVTSPVGIMQRSTYALSLPFRYAGPLMAAMILLHWFVSQSVFVVNVEFWGPGPDGEREPGLDASKLGYSITAMLAASLMGTVLIIGLCLNAARRYSDAPPWMPRIATDSAGLQALCHRPRDDEDAFLYPLRIVATDQGGDTKTVCFSTDKDARPPRQDEVYWQPSRVKKSGAGVHLPAWPTAGILRPGRRTGLVNPIAPA